VKLYLNYHPRPGSANLRVIAQAMVSQYPESLADYINERMLGDGCGSLHNRLVRYFENHPVSQEKSVVRRKLINETQDNDETSAKKK
jgi:hypothetical protein